MSPRIQALRARWQALSARDQLTVRLALAAIALGLGWGVLLAPALNTLRTAEREQPLLRDQLHRMLQLQIQARALQKQPRPSAADQTRALSLAVAPLGSSAHLQVQGKRAVVSLQQLPPGVLAAWLTQLQRQHGLQPAEAHLLRQTEGSSWNGALTFVLSAP